MLLCAAPSTKLLLNFEDFFTFLSTLADMQSWQVVHESSVRHSEAMAVTEGRVPVGIPNSLHI